MKSWDHQFSAFFVLLFTLLELFQGFGDLETRAPRRPLGLGAESGVIVVALTFPTLYLVNFFSEVLSDSKQS